MAKGKEKPPAVPPNPVGRPSDYRPEYCKMLEDHFAEGLSFEAFGGVVNAHKETLYTWTEKHPEFLDAKRRGVSKSRLLWEKLGNNGARGEVENFNSTAWIFNMKNRFGWRDNNSMPEWVKILLDNIGKFEEEQLISLAENLAKDARNKRAAND